jgi:hypothetical protein
VPFDREHWAWGTAEPRRSEHLGRECIFLETSTATVAGVELVDGAIEVELAVGPERGFHGVVWRMRDAENFDSFFVRPHQVGNPDAVQYTPVSNGISSWQLYHGPGFWAPVSFPLDDWFRIRVVYAGTYAEVYVAGLDEPALAIQELKRPVVSGRVGLMVGGPAIHVSRFAHGPAGVVPMRREPPPAEPALDGVIRAWWVSDPFAEAELGDDPALDPAVLAPRTWTYLPSEAAGLADLSRINGVREGRDTVFSRATIHSPRARVVRLDLGFSDRALVYLNGRALYRGDETYRSRDYRFLGSIGYWDTLYVELREGANELAVAVSEDFGGWGVQARFPDHAGLSFG